MIDDYYVGAYWKVKMLTLREYANQVKEFLKQLQILHPVFSNLCSVGDEPNSEIKLAPDLSNLDDLIYKFSWDRKDKYDKANPNGSPSWESTHNLGYMMTFTNSNYSQRGGVKIRISAGMYFHTLNNAVVIAFSANDFGFPTECYSYKFYAKLFELTVNFWQPEAALLTSSNFSDKVSYEYGSKKDFSTWEIGWLTYIDNPEVVNQLPPGVDYQLLKTGRSMIIISQEAISAENNVYVTKAIGIRDTLANKGLLEQRKYS